MAHGNTKNGGGSGAQRKRAPPKSAEGKSHRNPNSNGKRRRNGGSGGGDQAQPTTSASAAFLAALEAQRTKQAAEEPQSAPAVVPAPPSSNDGVGEQRARARAALPGFYFDEAKGRFFKLTKQSQQLQQQQQRRMQAASTREASGREQCVASETGRAVRRRGWMAFVAERQLLAGNAVHHRDRRELMPRHFASQLKSRALSRVDVGIHSAQDRFSAMDISPDSSSVFLGYATGCVRAFTAQPEPRDSNAQSLVELGIVDTAGMTVSCIRHHQRERGILISAVGARVSEALAPLMVRGGAPGTTGRVGLFSDSTFRQEPHVWELNDPWVVEWCPQQSNLFSVGLGGQQGAALVDCSAFRGGHVAMMAPTGRIKSDTLSQTFSQHTPVIIVNGARNGSWWTWDTRAPRRAMEIVKDSKDKSPGSIQCLHLLRDERRLVVQRSDGELAVLDLRSAQQHAPVTLFCSGERDAYRSMLHFDVDENETVVACAPPSSVALFDLSRGMELSQLRIPNHGLHTHHATGPPPNHAEHVIFRENQGQPSLWALSKSALYHTSKESMI